MERVALKIQRRKYLRDGVYEVGIHERLCNGAGPCREIVTIREAFLDDGHVCMVFDRHGRNLDDALEDRPLSVPQVRRATRQLLHALTHLHRSGLTHTDVKPGNILYDGRRREARLADLGSARDHLRQGAMPGTREYLPPEIILGSPLSPQLDLWSLGCTVFEMLTGKVLISARRAAARKYVEFSRGADAVEVPVAESVRLDEAAEKAEQARRGSVIAGKYRLERELGRGRFGTVWSAQPVSKTSLHRTHACLREAIPPREDDSAEKTEQEQLEHAWQSAKGADDLLDLTLNYEQVLLMASLCGPFPAAMLAEAKYRASYFEPDGALRFRPLIRPRPIRERLRRASKLTGDDLTEASDFLHGLLRIDPATRSTPEAALRHAWVTIRS